MALVRVAVAALLAVLGVGTVAAVATGQEQQAADPSGADADVRIVARRLDSGRVEFGVERRLSGDSWSERILPRLRFFPADADVGRWLRSSPLAVDVRDPGTTLRIAARRLDDGRVEFGVEQRLTRDSWSERILPRVRLLPPDADIGRWLRSSPLRLRVAADGTAATTSTTTVYSGIAAGFYHSCGVRRDGGVTCWGENGWRQADAPPGEFSALAAGARHTCGLKLDSTIVCWGDRTHQQTNAPVGYFHSITAGAYHSCAVATNNRVVCWGSNGSGQGLVPAGTYAGVSAGVVHSCGLRVDGTITCWGDNTYGQTEAPGGVFSAVASGDHHSCALDGDGALTCWGADSTGQSGAPSGEFIAVSGGIWHSCGVRRDATVACWGDNHYDQANAPDGAFESVAAGGLHSCGLRADGAIACWGNSRRPTAAPDGLFSELDAGTQHTCARRSDSTIECWGNQKSGRTSAPSGQFSRVSAGTWHSCGLRGDATLACWGDNSHGQANPPDGQYRAVSAGWLHSCALGGGGTVTCWGDNEHGQLDVPEGEFASVAAGVLYSCGVRDDGTVACWGNDAHGRARAPRGYFTSVAVGNDHSCGVRVDSTVACWGADWHGQSTPPVGEFSSVTVGPWYSCGLRTDATINCWGYNGGLARPPAGSFSAVTAGNRHVCGLRTNGTIACWHFTPMAATPPGVTIVTSADPDACKPHGTSQTTAGFPLPPWALPAHGTVRVAVLFVDFPHAAASHTTAREAGIGLPVVEQYLKASSYGKLDIEFVPLHRWLRADYSPPEFGEGLTGEAQRSLAEMAVRLADADFDFSAIDSVMFVMPSSHFSGGDAGWAATTREGVVPALTRINAFPVQDRPRPPVQWGKVAAHELLHNFGLADYYFYGHLYDSSVRQLPEAPPGKVWAVAVFGPMGFGGSFLTDVRDPRLAYIVRHANGATSTQHSDAITAREMLAWSRWLLGWLDETQIRCIRHPETSVSLTPVAAPGDGPAMAAIPLSDTEMLVIESRRRIGYDAGWDFHWTNGARAKLPGLAAEGVLVYIVDGAQDSGLLPIRLAADTGNGRLDSYPILTEGQSITTRGYTVTLESATDETHTVTITRNAEPASAGNS
ncbi:MAG: hypothetical protein OXI26_13455 [bacterium]|nr:hypothetical protein [bacterium]